MFFPPFSEWKFWFGKFPLPPPPKFWFFSLTNSKRGTQLQSTWSHSGKWGAKIPNLSGKFALYFDLFYWFKMPMTIVDSKPASRPTRMGSFPMEARVLPCIVQLETTMVPSPIVSFFVSGLSYRWSQGKRDSVDVHCHWKKIFCKTLVCLKLCFSKTRYKFTAIFLTAHSFKKIFNLLSFHSIF